MAVGRGRENKEADVCFEGQRLFVLQGKCAKWVI